MNQLHWNSEISSKYATLLPSGALVLRNLAHFCKLPTEQSDYLVDEDKEHIYFEANAPGIRAEEVEVLLDRGILTVKAGTFGKGDNSSLPFHRRRNYFYHVKLGDAVDLQRQPQATLRDGVIRIAFHKRVIDQPKKIPVSH